MDNHKNPVRGITYTELLQVMLIGLKLTHLIKWSSLLKGIYTDKSIDFSINTEIIVFV